MYKYHEYIESEKYTKIAMEDVLMILRKELEIDVQLSQVWPFNIYQDSWACMNIPRYIRAEFTEVDECELNKFIAGKRPSIVVDILMRKLATMKYIPSGNYLILALPEWN